MKTKFNYKPNLILGLIIILDLILYFFVFTAETTKWTVPVIILLSIPTFILIRGWYLSDKKSKDYWWLAGIALVTIITFIPSLGNAFTNWDDPNYVLNNLLIRNLTVSNLTAMFSQTYMGLYQPLGLLSLMLDYIPANLNPIHYHLTNTILHVINTILVFVVVRKLFTNKSIAIVTALFFGIHPLHVESVVWITERKDVLFTFFFLLSAYQYILYLKDKAKLKYSLALFFFLLSLMAKPQGVMLAPTLFIIDFIIDRKFNVKSLIEKIPFFILALFFGILTLSLMEGQVEEINFFDKIILSGFTFSVYLFKLVLPIGLSAIYPYPEALETIHYIGFLFFIIVLLMGYFSIRKSKPLAFGLWFFILNIILFLQIFPNTYVLMADRYSYIPSIGIFILFAILYSYLDKKYKKHIKLFQLGYLVWAIVLISSTVVRGNVWKSSLSLWEDTVKKHPNIPEALNNRGFAYYEQSNNKKAIADFNKAIKIDPEFSYAYINRGTIYLNQGKNEKALADYNKALDIFPEHANALINKGIIFRKQSKLQEALNSFNKALQISPNSIEALISRGTLYADLQNYEAATTDYNKVLSLDNKNAMAYSNRGLVYARQGNRAAAIADFTTCININPKFVDAYSNRGFTHYKNKRYYEAISDFTKAINLNSKFATAYMNRGNAYIMINNRQKACNDFQMAYNLGIEVAQQKMNQYCR